ncbi:hypothetical protein MAHJHV54_48050 [Mycobacterium avium subsp. hominissuis]
MTTISAHQLMRAVVDTGAAQVMVVRSASSSTGQAPARTVYRLAPRTAAPEAAAPRPAPAR